MDVKLSPASPIILPCGSEAVFEHTETRIGYRCETCLARVGSPQQPQACKNETEKYELMERLGGFGWDYIKGAQATER